MSDESGYADIRHSINEFLQRLPDLLDSFADITIDERREFDAGIREVLKKKSVSVAVTGKMKQGKSSLINALIERDLPITGVTEATATLNYVEHLSKSSNGDPDSFMVRWLDGRPDSTHKLDEFSEFIGEEGKKKQEIVNYITMFASAEFLKKVQLIDTPGEQGTQLESIKINPDALLRAFPFEPEANDESKLNEYANETRQSGAWPYNTLAVTQRWEQFWPSNLAEPFEGSPLDPAYRRAQEQAKTFEKAVAKVIPVSGLLWRFSSKVSLGLLHSVLDLCNRVSRKEFLTLLLMEELFLETPNEQAEPEERAALLEGFKKELGRQSDAAWPVLKMAIWAAVAKAPDDAEGLRAELRALSNIETLRHELDVMFFRRAELIQIATTLKKVLDIASDAADKLDRYREALVEDIRDADAALTEIRAIAGATQQGTSVTQTYLKRSREHLLLLKTKLDSVIKPLLAEKQSVDLQLNTLMEDTKWLRAMDDQALAAQLEQRNETERCRALFGHHGGETYKRLGLEKSADQETLRKQAWAELRYWKMQDLQTIGDHARLVEYAVTRVDRLIKTLNSNKGGGLDADASDKLVVVTGKMKQGKSSLINALIERDLPTTGLIEARGPLNCVEHLSNSFSGDPDSFVVRWVDGRPDSTHKLDEFSEAICERGIERITMFAYADFLKNVRIIDTPGEHGTQLKPIKIKPDVLVRVLPFWPEANDESKLNEYANETRQNGAWPFNTLAVTQKWEQFWPSNLAEPFEGSPLDPAYVRAGEQAKTFEKAVAKVIPVSGLLWRFASNVEAGLLQQVRELCARVSRDDLLSLLKREERFTNMAVDGSEPSERAALLERFKRNLGRQSDAAWPMLKMTIWAAVAKAPTGAEALRTELRVLSNMDTFRRELADMLARAPSAK